MARTRRVDCADPGIARRRHGRGFSYRQPDGSPVTDPQVLARIDALVIPPAWREVWICRDPRGHLQVTGIDAAGRKQYRYHDDWRARRDAVKFDAMVDFARALPQLRRRVASDLRRPALDAARVNACAVRMLDIGLFRIGSEDYAERHGTFGLTTIRKEHVSVRDGTIVFDYPAKHGRRHLLQIADPDVCEIVCTLKRRRSGGPELLAHRRGRQWADLSAANVNEYLKDATGGDFSAKDFRTWNATALCALVLARHAGDWSRSRRSRARAVSTAINEVAGYLGNTPAVCRRSYVDPRVIDRFSCGLTIAAALAGRGRAAGDGAGDDEEDCDAPGPQQALGERVRRAVLDLIAGDSEAPGVRRIVAD